jgi:hypothetical protein
LTKGVQEHRHVLIFPHPQVLQAGHGNTGRDQRHMGASPFCLSNFLPSPTIKIFLAFMLLMLFLLSGRKMPHIKVV